MRTVATYQYVEILQDRLEVAVEYAQQFRSAIEPESVEACEKAIRYANMLSHAIIALSGGMTKCANNQATLSHDTIEES